MKGGDDADQCYGGKGNDTVTGDGGQDTLWGDNGDDIFLASDGEVDSLDGGSGYDRAKLDNTFDPIVNGTRDNEDLYTNMEVL